MTDPPDDLDHAGFAAGEAVADLLAWGGMDQAVVGGRVVAHARRLDPPTAPLVGYGDPVRSGDLVEVHLHDGRPQNATWLVILNQYDTDSGNVNFVCPDRYGYGISAALLAGGGWRRTFRRIEPAPPDWRPHTNRTLADDDTVAALDLRFAKAGQPRPTSMVDLPTRAWPKTPGGIRHAVPAGTTLACCKTQVPPPPDTAPVFAADTPGTCRRCSAQVTAAARGTDIAAGPAVATCADRTVRHQLYARCFRKQFFAPD